MNDKGIEHIGVNPGVGSHDPQILGWGSWMLHEIFLYPVMCRNIRWKHFPQWWLFKNRKICEY